MAQGGQRIARCRPGTLLRVSALVAAAVTGSASAQGVYPGPLSKEGYKLPGGFEPVVNLRSYYFDQESTSGAPSTAWALGGWAGVRSPWWGDMVQVGLVGYTSLPLYAPNGEGGNRLLTVDSADGDQESIAVLGEAFAALRLGDQTLTAFRQLLNRPFINPQDNRMVPNTFEAYTIGGAFDGMSYIGGYITKIKPRDANGFRWMSEAAGSSDHKGVVFAGGTYTFDKERSGYVRLDEQYSVDTFNSFYADVRYPLVIDDKTTVVLGAQAFPQSAVGNKQLGSFSTWGYGLQAAVAYGPFEGQLYWTQTGKERDTLNPYGDHPSYLNLMQVAFNTAGEKAWGLGGKVDFGPYGAPGLSAAAVYASGSDRITFGTGAPLGDRNETDVRVDYAFPKGSAAEGLSGAVRYSWLREDGAAQTGTQLRIYLNYAVRF